MLNHFSYDHLRGDLQEVSKQFHNLAHWIDANLTGDAETAMALRKLLEAKDAAVRSAALLGTALVQEGEPVAAEQNTDTIAANFINADTIADAPSPGHSPDLQVLGAIVSPQHGLVFTVRAVNKSGEEQVHEVVAENSIDAAYRVMQKIKDQSNG